MSRLDPCWTAFDRPPRPRTGAAAASPARTNGMSRAMARGTPRCRTLGAAGWFCPSSLRSGCRACAFPPLGCWGRWSPPSSSRSGVGPCACRGSPSCSPRQSSAACSRCFHPGHPRRDTSRLAAVGGRRVVGRLRQRDSRLAAGAKPGAAGNDGDLGLVSGAATAMTVMCEAFGADARLVAFMQYLRVVLVAVIASGVARISVGRAAPGRSIRRCSPPSPGGHCSRRWPWRSLRWRSRWGCACAPGR